MDAQVILMRTRAPRVSQTLQSRLLLEAGLANGGSWTDAERDPSAEILGRAVARTWQMSGASSVLLALLGGADAGGGVANATRMRACLWVAPCVS